MKTIKTMPQNMSIADWIFGLISLGAIVFSILSFFGRISITWEQTVSILIGAIGLLMAAVVALGARRRTEIQELKSAIGVSEFQTLNTSREFGLHLVQSIGRTKHFVLDTSLNSVYPKLPASSIFYGPHAEYERLLYDKVIKGDIEFNYVGIIFHRQALEHKIFDLLLYEGYEYYLRHCAPPLKAFPIINMMSFDDEIFYLGGFHTKTTAARTEALYIRSASLAQLLKEYWTALWSEAIPLNEGKIINWEELIRIGLTLGIDKAEFERMVSKVKEEVQREKRKLR